ncbi:hypothetical protein [Staphylococcus aureus]
MEEDGVLKDGERYEIMRGEVVGVRRSELALGKLCGKDGL